MEKKVFKYDDINIKITASFGVYCVKNTETDPKKLNIETFIKLVDSKLYEAKKNGKNNVVVY
ncbi:GGDEF domain-containing protein [Caldicellulosiruptor naganoensis]|uniref:GGDEF domain-containing protein n=1 Tax=Caldicellulosiruptor naganoensis TaxID=29324 RepID=UPI000D52A339